MNTTMTEEASYKELLKERQDLEQRIQEARRREFAKALSQVRELVSEFDMSPQDVFPVGRASRGAAAGGNSAATNAGQKVPPKYRDPQTGKTWTGRGKPPLWIQGQDREQFAI